MPRRMQIMFTNLDAHLRVTLLSAFYRFALAARQPDKLHSSSSTLIGGVYFSKIVDSFYEQLRKFEPLGSIALKSDLLFNFG